MKSYFLWETLLLFLGILFRMLVRQPKVRLPDVKRNLLKEGSSTMEGIAKLLISTADRVTLYRAANLLMKSDAHDQFFYEQLKLLEKKNGVNNPTHIVDLGSDIKVVKTSEPVTRKTVNVEETSYGK